VRSHAFICVPTGEVEWSVWWGWGVWRRSRTLWLNSLTLDMLSPLPPLVGNLHLEVVDVQNQIAMVARRTQQARRAQRLAERQG
jgi:hypothetical protein